MDRPFHLHDCGLAPGPVALAHRALDWRRGLLRRHAVAAGLALACALTGLPGCTWVSYLGTDLAGSEHGRVYYLGGAGEFGNVGVIDVPAGLRRAGYCGSIEVFGWQSVLGGTIRDQVDRARNEAEGRRLAQRIQAYHLSFPDEPIHIIALSAGTGVAAWALEALPPELQVDSVVLLSSSLSSEFDLSAALRHVRGRVHNFYNPGDPVLRFLLPLAGSVDRDEERPSVAGLTGFVLPRSPDPTTVPNRDREGATPKTPPSRDREGADPAKPLPDARRSDRDPGFGLAPTPAIANSRVANPAIVRLYQEHLENHAYRNEYTQYGYWGLHADSTSADFIQHVVAPLMFGGNPPSPPPSVTRTSR